MFGLPQGRELLASRRLKAAFLVVCVGFLLAQWVRIGVKPQGDFPLHWTLGRNLLDGRFIYADGDYPYPPFWALAHAPLTLIPLHAAQVLFVSLFVASLLVLLWTLRRMTERKIPLGRDVAFWATAASIVTASRFLFRDILECGVNLALVAASYLAVYLWQQRREVAGGVCLGAAMALKCTPTLFWAYFVWKRQWRMAATTFAAAALFTLSPVLVMGVEEFSYTFRFWLNGALVGASTSDPSIGVLGPEQLQNMSLRPALARYLMHLPAGHPGRYDGPGYIDFFDFSPATAGAIIKAITLALGVYAAWRMRPRTEPRDAVGITWECAAVSLLLLLISPITWGQHCVGALPAAFLVWRQAARDGRLPRSTTVALVAFLVVNIVLNRGLLGTELTFLLDSYHAPTATLLALAFVVLMHRPEPGIAIAADGETGADATIARRAA